MKPPNEDDLDTTRATREPLPRRQEEAPVSKPGRSNVPESLLLGGGLLLFFAMLFEMREPLQTGGFVSPVLLALAGGLLVWPIRQQRPARTLMAAGGLLLLLWLLAELSTVLAPFAVVFLVAYLFNPLATLLDERYRVPRWASSLGVTVLVVGLIVLFVLQVVPNILGQLETLAGRVLGSVEQLQAWLASTTFLDRFDQTGLIDKEQLIARTTTSIRELADSFTANLPMLAEGVLTHLASLFGIITVVAIVPVLLFYMLKDYPLIKLRLFELFPTFGGERGYLVQAGEVVGSYLRAQLLISAIAAINVSIALLIFQVPLALLIGLMTGVLNLVPNIGALITAVLGVLIAVVFGDPWLLDAVVVVAVLMGQNLLEQSVLQPKIMSNRVGLHPVLIFLSLFIFGYFLGAFGLLIAVPVTALLMAVYKAYRHELTLDLSPEARLKRDLSKRLLGRLRG